MSDKQINDTVSTRTFSHNFDSQAEIDGPPAIDARLYGCVEALKSTSSFCGEGGSVLLFDMITLIFNQESKRYNIGLIGKYDNSFSDEQANIVKLFDSGMTLRGIDLKSEDIHYILTNSQRHIHPQRDWVNRSNLPYFSTILDKRKLWQRLIDLFNSNDEVYTAIINCYFDGVSKISNVWDYIEELQRCQLAHPIKAKRFVIALGTDDEVERRYLLLAVLQHRCTICDAIKRHCGPNLSMNEAVVKSIQINGKQFFVTELCDYGIKNFTCIPSMPRRTVCTIWTSSHDEPLGDIASYVEQLGDAHLHHFDEHEHPHINYIKDESKVECVIPFLARNQYGPADNLGMSRGLRSYTPQTRHDMEMLCRKCRVSFGELVNSQYWADHYKGPGHFGAGLDLSPCRIPTWFDAKRSIVPIAVLRLYSLLLSFVDSVYRSQMTGSYHRDQIWQLSETESTEIENFIMKESDFSCADFVNFLYSAYCSSPSDKVPPICYKWLSDYGTMCAMLQLNRHMWYQMPEYWLSSIYHKPVIMMGDTRRRPMHYVEINSSTIAFVEQILSAICSDQVNNAMKLLDAANAREKGLFDLAGMMVEMFKTVYISDTSPYMPAFKTTSGYRFSWSIGTWEADAYLTSCGAQIIKRPISTLNIKMIGISYNSEFGNIINTAIIKVV
jgi:hypothetical protein